MSNPTFQTWKLPPIGGLLGWCALGPVTSEDETKDVKAYAYEAALVTVVSSQFQRDRT